MKTLKMVAVAVIVAACIAITPMLGCFSQMMAAYFTARYSVLACASLIVILFASAFLAISLLLGKDSMLRDENGELK